MLDSLEKEDRIVVKCALWMFVSALALSTVPASACHVVGYKNGEAICQTTSDGEGKPYKLSPTKTKTIGDIQVTTSAHPGSRATGSQSTSSRVRVLSANTIRRKHNWH
jgi:hypothetical protein